MQIDPQAETFGDIADLAAETEEQRARFEKAVAEGKIVAHSHDKDALQRLQDDLRKAGYKKAS